MADRIVMWLAEDEAPYDYADRLIMDLFSEGYEICSNPQPLKIGSTAEVAARLGISRQWVAALQRREEFPEPLVKLAVGSIWDLDEVATWYARNRHKPGRRPKVR